MQPRAFVVMPFGQKPAGPTSGLLIDFNRVYTELLEPALKLAGFEAVRADTEQAAGDIRTSMFFELITADLVVADVTDENPNVFYELGIRDGVCPRGVFIVSGSSRPLRPFDIASDRSFGYVSSPFLDPHPDDNAQASVKDQQQLLAKTFKAAMALEQEAIGSPVYSHLPGLEAVNWDGIQTSKAKYLASLQADWLDCVRRAQAAGRPGDIVTLAMNPPTRLHVSRMLFEAASALIGLLRYGAAETVLRDLVRVDPANTDAQFQLALVLSRQNKVVQAEQQLRKMSADYKNQPQAANVLGQVFRHRWHLSWKPGATAEERRTSARDSSQLAVSAVQSFLKAHRADPNQYFAGLNALMLVHLLDDLSPSERHWTPNELDEVAAVTRYVASNQRQQAIESGDYEQQFWSTTTLAGLIFVNRKDEWWDKKGDAILTYIHEACAIPGATSFQLQSFRDRLELLEELDIEAGLVQRALEIVDASIGLRSNKCACQRVFVWAGYPLDDPKRPAPRFPASSEEAVSKAIEKALEDWAIKAGDLGICGGTTESDVIFAEKCLELGASVRIMMREPIGSESSEPLWPFASAGWHGRFHRLLQPGARKETWIDTEHLGNPIQGYGGQNPRDVAVRRQNQWLISTAEMEAEAPTPLKRPFGERPPSSSERLYGLFLWDGLGTGDDVGEPSFLIQRINKFNGYQGQVRTINPTGESPRPEVLVAETHSES